MTTYEPGTVAVATVRGVENVRVMLTKPSDGDDWVSIEAIKSYHWHRGEHVTDIRPLVVLDCWHPNANDVPTLLSLLREHYWMELAEQIEAQTKPPRIPEPGLWGVVAADGQGLDDVHWVRTKASPPWLAVEHGRYAEWQQLHDPILIREGLS